MKLSVEEIDKARKILGLREEASLQDIKTAYRNLSKKWHPDSCKEENKQKCADKMKEINEAYGIIMEYIEDYKYPFSAKKISADNPEERLKKQFGNDPFWGM